MNEIIKTWIHFKDSKSCTVKMALNPFSFLGVLKIKGHTLFSFEMNLISEFGIQAHFEFVHL